MLFWALCKGIYRRRHPPRWAYGHISHISRRDSPLPLGSCPGPLFVIFERDDEEHKQGDALNPCQEEEIVVQMAAVDVTCSNRNKGSVRGRWLYACVGHVQWETAQQLFYHTVLHRVNGTQKVNVHKLANVFSFDMKGRFEGNLPGNVQFCQDQDSALLFLIAPQCEAFKVETTDPALQVDMVVLYR